MKEEEEEGATLEEIFQAVYYPETVKFKNKKDKEFWDRICSLTDKEAKEIFKKLLK